jgi:hypothetical protein
VSLSKSECEVIAQALNEMMEESYLHDPPVYRRWEEEIEDHVESRDLRTYVPEGMNEAPYLEQELYAQVQERLALVRKVLCTGRCD